MCPHEGAGIADAVSRTKELPVPARQDPSLDCLRTVPALRRPSSTPAIRLIAQVVVIARVVDRWW